MPDAVYNLYDAKTHLSKLVDRAANGEVILIAKGDKPLARLVPLHKEKIRRHPGGWEGKVRIADNFDDSLPADLLDAFGGGSDES